MWLWVKDDSINFSTLIGCLTWDWDETQGNVQEQVLMIFMVRHSLLINYRGQECEQWHIAIEIKFNCDHVALPLPDDGHLS